MRIEVLGPVRLSTDTGVPVEVAEKQLRMLLACLVAARGEPVSADAMIDRLWDRDLPADPRKVLQGKLSRLRTLLDTARPGTRELLVHTPAGYRLTVDDEVLDAAVFRDSVVRARRWGPSRKKAESLTESLALWRGEPFGDMAEKIWLAPVVAELRDLRTDAVEALVETLVELGEPEQALAQAIGSFEEHTAREGLVSSVMIALYQVGRQHEALELYEKLRRHLAAELGVDPTPGLRELHGHILRQDPVLTPRNPPESEAVTLPGHSNLPAEITPLIGRRAEIERVRTLLAASRLVTLTGVGGVGKTRLALHVAKDRDEDFVRGTWFIDLTELSPRPEGGHPEAGERIAALAASALGIPDLDTTPNPLGRLSEALGSRPTLLLLDNCEHVVAEATSFTSDVLRRVPSLRVLATSRAPLGLPEEQRYEVGTLGTEPSADGPSEAATFFATRARASDPGFQLDQGNAAEVERLCRRLDGLPLALELAAVRIRGLSVTGLLDRLGDRLKILRRPGHAAPRRQRTLRGMLDWSWSLLDARDQAVLRRLAVHFGTSIDLETAEAICADGPYGPGSPTVERTEVVDILLGLVDCSLVTATSTPTGVRYGLLESIAAYAGEELATAGERRETAQRHLRRYCDFARAADRGLRTRRQRHWLARFAAERVQLRLAFDEAVRSENAAAATTLVLASFWHRVCVPGFSISPVLGGYQARLVADLQTVSGLTGAGGDDRAAVTTLAACMSLDPEDGEQRIEQALRGFDAETVTKGRVQWFAGASLLAVGLREVGERHVDEALAILADHGEDWDLAVAACRRDWLIISLWREAPRGVRDRRDVSDTRLAVDDGYVRLYSIEVERRFAELVGDQSRSKTAVTAGRSLSRAMGIASETSYWGTAAAITAFREGRSDDALADLATARAIAAEIGFTIGVAYADLGEAMIARHRDDPAGARALLDRWRGFSQAARAELGTEFEQGFLAVQEHDFAAARAALEELVTSTPEQGDTRTTARMLELAAAIRCLAEDSRAAAECLGAAEAMRVRAGAAPSVPERRDIQRVHARVAETLSETELSAAIASGAELSARDQLHAASEAEPPSVG